MTTTQRTIRIAGNTFSAELRVEQREGKNYTASQEWRAMDLTVAVLLGEGSSHPGDALKFMRKACGLVRASLAQSLGFPEATLIQWEASKHVPDTAWNWVLERVRNTISAEKIHQVSLQQNQINAALIFNLSVPEAPPL